MKQGMEDVHLKGDTPKRLGGAGGENRTRDDGKAEVLRSPLSKILSFPQKPLKFQWSRKKRTVSETMVEQVVSSSRRVVSVSWTAPVGYTTSDRTKRAHKEAGRKHHNNFSSKVRE